jgi:hypothetical protein
VENISSRLLSRLFETFSFGLQITAENGVDLDLGSGLNWQVSAIFLCVSQSGYDLGNYFERIEP